MAPECARNSELCRSWASGMHMMHGLMVGLKRRALYCRPDGVINSQIIQVYQVYLRNNPEKLHMPAETLFVLAMQQAFPCR
jgi:Rap1a immunity proteins